MINTKKVTGRRHLHFQRLEDIEEDARRLASANVKPLGNWTLGQVLNHLATVMHQSIDGVPMQVAWWIRLVGPLVKKRLIARGMPAGFKIPQQAVKAMVPDGGATADEGLIALREAIQRLESETHRSPHPVFGNLTCVEWDQVHMRHAELHLSFIVPA